MLSARFYGFVTSDNAGNPRVKFRVARQRAVVSVKAFHGSVAGYLLATEEHVIGLVYRSI